MKYQLITLFFTLLLSLTAHSKPVDIDSKTQGAIGQYTWFLKESNSQLGLEEAIEAFTADKFIASNDSVMSFAIGSKPVWVKFDIANSGLSSEHRIISIETSWLDKIDAYFLQGEILKHYVFGDTMPFIERPIDSRFFMLNHLFEPGTTSVYIRVETPDPLVLPIYVTTTETMHARDIMEGYSYGIIYGIIFALLLYNLMLHFGLKSSRYLYYSIYLFLFLIMNISYTGHGYKWLWPDSPTLQAWANPVLMMAYAISGLLFATRFLDTKIYFPRLHRITIGGCQGFAIALTLAILGNQQVLALLLSFTFVLLFASGMILLGALSFYAGNKSAKYFLYASVIAALGATITALTVWSFIPYNTYTYRAVDIGTAIEAILLAFALSNQFHLIQKEKVKAEQMARIDPLTKLNNRRAFSELVDPMWKTGIRKQHDMSLILMDIDSFKSINDRFGHLQGDKALARTAKVLTQSARAGDILARWGGEEFILFMPETTLTDAVAAAERMREKISAIRFEHENKTLLFTASFGVGSYNEELNTLNKLISSTDNHLYRAKKSGRNKVCSPLSD